MGAKSKEKIKVLFVCLGNICRSPMAEGTFTYLVNKAGLSNSFEIDSAGTAGYHIGALADERMREVASSHGIKLLSKARQIQVGDLTYYDYILAMDETNFQDIQNMWKTNLTNLYLMRDFDTQGSEKNVPDPYYGGLSGFKEVFQIQMRASENLLKTIMSKTD